MTSWRVGTTTIRLGVTRQGPSAPCACQLGKYETFTSTGVPSVLTWKFSDWSPTRTSETVVGATGTTGARAPGRTRGQRAGPPAARSTGQSPGSSYQAIEGVSQLDWLGRTPVSTAGSALSGVTSAESVTMNTSQVVVTYPDP